MLLQVGEQVVPHQPGGNAREQHVCHIAHGDGRIAGAAVQHAAGVAAEPLQACVSVYLGRHSDHCRVGRWPGRSHTGNQGHTEAVAAVERCVQGVIRCVTAVAECHQVNALVEQPGECFCQHLGPLRVGAWNLRIEQQQVVVRVAVFVKKEVLQGIKLRNYTVQLRTRVGF